MVPSGRRCFRAASTGILSWSVRGVARPSLTFPSGRCERGGGGTRGEGRRGPQGRCVYRAPMGSQGKIGYGSARLPRNPWFRTCRRTNLGREKGGGKEGWAYIRYSYTVLRSMYVRVCKHGASSFPSSSSPPPPQLSWPGTRPGARRMPRMASGVAGSMDVRAGRWRACVRACHVLHRPALVLLLFLQKVPPIRQGKSLLGTRPSGRPLRGSGRKPATGGGKGIGWVDAGLPGQARIPIHSPCSTRRRRDLSATYAHRAIGDTQGLGCRPMLRFVSASYTTHQGSHKWIEWRALFFFFLLFSLHLHRALTRT